MSSLGKVPLFLIALLRGQRIPNFCNLMCGGLEISWDLQSTLTTLDTTHPVTTSNYLFNSFSPFRILILHSSISSLLQLCQNPPIAPAASNVKGVVTPKTSVKVPLNMDLLRTATMIALLRMRMLFFSTKLIQRWDTPSSNRLLFIPRGQFKTSLHTSLRSSGLFSSSLVSSESQ